MTLLDRIFAIVLWVASPLLAAMSNYHGVAHASPSRITPDPSVFPNLFQNKNGLWINYKSWLPINASKDQIRGLVFICPGLAEHTARYDGIATELARDKHMAVFAIDHQGQGLSEGNRKVVDKFEDFVDDYCQFMKVVFDRNADDVVKYEMDDLSVKPRFLLGHSMGGLISTYVTKMGETGLKAQYVPQFLFNKEPSTNILVFDGVILSGPFLMMNPDKMTAFNKFIVSNMCKVLPNLCIGGVDINAICGNQQVVEYGEGDHLFSKEGVRLRWVTEMLKAIDGVHKEPASYIKEAALLCVHGSDDTLTMPKGTTMLFDKCETKRDKQMVIYPGMLHEIINDGDRRKVRDDVYKFIEGLL